MSKDIFEEHYLEIVSDPRFKLFGLTREEILSVRERMDMYAVKQIADVLKPKPGNTPPEERWKDVTADCVVQNQPTSCRTGIRHCGPGNAVSIIYEGYRFRRVRAIPLAYASPKEGEVYISRDGDILWTFVIEQKVPE